MFISQLYRHCHAGLRSRVVLLALLLSACEDEYEVVEGDLVLFEYSPEFTPCAGNAAALDALALQTVEFFGRPRRQGLRYTWRSGTPEGFWVPKGVCSPGGCATGGHAFSAAPFHVHELAHVALGTGSKAFFVEGIATAVTFYDDLFETSRSLSGRYLDLVPGQELPDPRETMGSLVSRGVDYEVAGAFVTFLIVRHGPAKFSDFYDRVGVLDSMAQIRAAFRRVYEVELDDEADAFMRGDPCPDEPFLFLPPECESPDIPWSDDRWSFGAVLACEEDETVVGGYGTKNGEFDLARRAVTFTVPDAGLYDVRYAGDLGTEARYGPCFGCPWDAYDSRLGDDFVGGYNWLEPGVYYLVLYGDPSSPQSAGLSIEPVD